MRILRIVRNVVQVVHAGRILLRQWRQWQKHILCQKPLHVSGGVPEMLQMQMCEMLQKLQMLNMLQLLQLQLRDSCNNDGMRYLQVLGCEGAAEEVYSQ